MTTGTDVYHAERILKAAGYFEGVPDKRLDEETLDAVKKFQSSVNIRVTGNIDPVTRDKLNELLDTLRTQNDPQYVKGMRYSGCSKTWDREKKSGMAVSAMAEEQRRTHNPCGKQKRRRSTGSTCKDSWFSLSWCWQ